MSVPKQEQILNVLKALLSANAHQPETIEVLAYLMWKHERLVRRTCEACGGELTVDDYYMVHDDVWLSVMPKKGFLHMQCLERRLGRFLTIQDFTSSIVNNLIVMGVRLGVGKKTRIEVLEVEESMGRTKNEWLVIAKSFSPGSKPLSNALISLGIQPTHYMIWSPEERVEFVMKYGDGRDKAGLKKVIAEYEAKFDERVRRKKKTR